MFDAHPGREYWSQDADRQLMQAEERESMPRGQDLIGLPVLSWPALRRIGRVFEVLVNTERMCICGLVLDEGGLLHPRRVLDFTAVVAVGPSHLLAEERYLNGEETGRACRELLRLPVLDGAGTELGMLDDLQFDRQSGRVTALQLSRGLVDDLLTGKPLVGVPEVVRAGEAAILLDGPGELAGGALD